MSASLFYKFRIAALQAPMIVQEIVEAAGKDDAKSAGKLEYLMKACGGATEGAIDRLVAKGDAAALERLLKKAKLTPERLDAYLAYVFSPRCILDDGVKQDLGSVFVRYGARLCALRNDKKGPAPAGPF